MSVQFKNNASSTLADALTISDLGLLVATGTGADFPAITDGDYFYLTIEDTNGAFEIVKVTARTGDSMTITRAQEGTNAAAFPAGTSCTLRVTAQGILDAVASATISDGSISLAKLANITSQRLIGRDTSGSGPVQQVPISTAIDWLGSTRGQVLYRGAASWLALAPGSAGQLLQTNGAGADPSWSTGFLLTDADKGDVVVSGSGTNWTIDTGAVTLGKMANLSQYSLIGRSSSGSGVPEAVATSAAVYTLLGSATQAAIRTNAGLGTISTQDSSAVSVTGGVINNLTELQGTMKLCTNTTGTLALADANTFIPMTGNVTIDGAVFSARQAFLFYAGSSARTITQGSSMTLRLAGSSTTGDRTLAAYTLAVGVVIGPNEVAISGIGVT